jgi:hypothetical protein
MAPTTLRRSPISTAGAMTDFQQAMAAEPEMVSIMARHRISKKISE